MSDNVTELCDQFDRADQEIKRNIGQYLHNRPAQWIAKQELVDEFGIDESGIGRHLDDLFEEGYGRTKKIEHHLHAQWEGRGAGGLKYWIRQAVPPQLWSAGSELRPLLTLDTLGGAFLPTLLFGVLLIAGFIGGFSALIISYYPGDTLFGVSTLQVTVLTGILTVAASMFLIFIPLAMLVERGIWKIWYLIGDTDPSGNNEGRTKD